MKTIVLLLSFLWISNCFAQSDSAIDLKDVQITAGRIAFSDGLKTITYDSTFLSGKPTSLNDLLRENNSVYLKNYGSGGLSTITLRGGSSYQTNILWNGLSLASPLNGLTDLNLENTFLFDEISLQYGGSSAQWGSGAVSGTIQLNNVPTFNAGLQAVIAITTGSFNNQKQRMKIGWSNGKYAGIIRAYNNDDKNNFIYKNNEDNTERLNHSAIKKYGLLSENYFKVSKSSVISLFIWHENSVREIPPAINQTNSLAKQKDIATRIYAGYNFKIEKTEINFRSGCFIEQINYADDFVAEPSENRSRNFINELTIERKLFNRHHLLGGISHTYSVADSSVNLKQPSVSRVAAFLLYRYESTSKTIGATFGLRQEFSSLKNSPLIFSGGINLRPAKSLSLRASASRVFRNPTLNDLYWTPGGNVNLQPEIGYSTEGGIGYVIADLSKLMHFLPASALSFDVSYYYKTISDWIIWYPSQSFVWRPQNLLSVHSRGVETRADFKINRSEFILQTGFGFAYTLSTNEKTKLTNDASLHKQLIYVPEYIYNAHIYSGYKSVSLRLNYSHTGYRYTATDNSAWLDPYNILNASIDKKISMKHFALTCSLSINNIFDASYQSVLNRPMPLRTYEAGITLSYKKYKS